ncbi:MAG: hypothetical protein J7641_13700 [Cyanobacteria bacterium SID2]|nr:hypothetical protein [Cyanobacteria bacterium SID2]MBP0002844.1 hypothetical protein [Cyanobacteria bacterium SBC]
MTQPKLHDLAREGNAQAISALLNQFLKSQGVRSKVALKEGCLHIILESEGNAPDRASCVELVRAKVVHWEIEGIERVRVYGRKTGELAAAWNQEFAVAVGGYSNLLFSHSRGTTGTPEIDNSPPISQPPKPARPKSSPRIFVGIFIFIAIVFVSIGAYIVLQNSLDSPDDTEGFQPRTRSQPI